MFGANAFGWAYLGQDAVEVSGAVGKNDSDGLSFSSSVTLEAATTAGDAATAYDATTAAASIAFVSVSAKGSSLTVTLPAGTARNDLVIIQFFLYSESDPYSLNAPTGWTIIDPRPGGTGGGQILAWRFLDGTEGASVTFTASGAGSASFNTRAVAYRGVSKTAGPFGPSSAHAYVINNSAGNPSLGPVTLDQDGEVAIAFYWFSKVGTLVDWTADSPATARWDDAGSIGFTGLDDGLVDLPSGSAGTSKTFTGSGGGGSQGYDMYCLVPVSFGFHPTITLAVADSATFTSTSPAPASSTPTSVVDADSAAASDAVAAANAGDFDVFHLAEAGSAAALTDTTKSASDSGTESETGVVTPSTGIASSDTGTLTSTTLITVSAAVDLNDQDRAALAELYALLVAVSASDGASLIQNDGGSPGGGGAGDGGGTGSAGGTGVLVKLGRRSLQAWF